MLEKHAAVVAKFYIVQIVHYFYLIKFNFIYLFNLGSTTEAQVVPDVFFRSRFLCLYCSECSHNSI